MASFLGRLLGVPDNPPVEAKAATGAGVYALTFDVPFESLSRNPQKLARQAQALYRSHPWVHAAEAAIVSRASAVGWHLEDATGNTIGDQPGEAHPALDLLMHPAPEQFGPIPAVARKRLWKLTLRHAGICGYAFWYLDQRELLGNTPLRIAYINPARMVPAEDNAGNLIGWVMDPDRPNGRPAVAFRPDEILPFILDPDDDGHLGLGLVEAAISKVRLTEKADIHATKSVAAGGRKPGIIMPTDAKGAFSTDEYDAVVRELRNVTDSPDAAKKSLIFKLPVDYKDAGTTPNDLQLADIMKLGREDIFGIWGVPMSQKGFAGSVGLNSGDARAYDEATLWQGPIKDRLDMFTETIQSGLLDRFDAVTGHVELELHLPTFDDKGPAYDLAVKAENQPLTDNERRAIIGLPPLPDPLGTVIRLPSTMVVAADVPPETDTSDELAEGGEIKAKAEPLGGLRRQTMTTWEPRIRRAVTELLGEQAAAIASRVRAHHGHILAKPGDTSVWWDGGHWDRRWREVLQAQTATMTGEVARKTLDALKRTGKAGFTDAVLNAIVVKSGKRITGINQVTRDAIAGLIADAAANDVSLDDLIASIRDATSFDDARAEMIARTETAYAYNDAQTSAYGELGVEKVDVIDGDGDEVCAQANGETWTLAQANEDPLGHPNCTRDFVPVL